MVINYNYFVVTVYLMLEYNKNTWYLAQWAGNQNNNNKNIPNINKSFVNEVNTLFDFCTLL